MTEKQNKIIDVSLDIILTNGIKDLTLKKIGEKLGVTDASLFKHFNSKVDIIYGILEKFQTDSDLLLSGITKNSDSNLKKIELFFNNRVETFSKDRAMLMIMFSNEIFMQDKNMDEKYISIIDSHRKLLIELIGNGQKSGEIKKEIPADHIFLIIMGSLRLLITKWKTSSFLFDITTEGNELWKSLEKIFKV